jgi:hypothetical protein
MRLARVPTGLLVLALLAAPLAAEAQREKVSGIVVFDVNSPTPEVWHYEHVEVVE